jgi:hypothetical protein
MLQRGVCVVAGLLLATGCGSGGVEPRVVQGLADANADGTVIAVREDDSDKSGESYIVAGADFRLGDGPVQEGGSTTCVEPEAAGKRVRLGIVSVNSEDEGFTTREHVVWVHCLDE